MRHANRAARVAAPATAPAETPRTLREALPVVLRHGSPRVLLAALAAALALRTALGGFTAWDLAPAATLVALWPLQEWAIHVFVLHWRPRRVAGRLLDFRVPRSHRAHHRDPWNAGLVFIPFHSFLYTLPLLAALWWAVTPDLRLAATGVVGHLALALHYEVVHYLIHTRVAPRTAYYRGLWRSHRLHHFRNEHYWFGVTRVEADRWLRTAPDPNAVPSSPTARTLGVTDVAA
jgi:hypothetical protein